MDRVLRTWSAHGMRVSHVFIDDPNGIVEKSDSLLVTWNYST